MPRLVVDLSRDELERLYDRASTELRHPRNTARLLLRQALGLPEQRQRQDPSDPFPRAEGDRTEGVPRGA